MPLFQVNSQKLKKQLLCPFCTHRQGMADPRTSRRHTVCRQGRMIRKRHSCWGQIGAGSRTRSCSDCAPPAHPLGYRHRSQKILSFNRARRGGSAASSAGGCPETWWRLACHLQMSAAFCHESWQRLQIMLTASIHEQGSSRAAGLASKGTSASKSSSAKERQKGGHLVDSSTVQDYSRYWDRI